MFRIVHRDALGCASNLESHIDASNAPGLDVQARSLFGFEALLPYLDVVASDRKIWNGVHTGRIRHSSALHARCYIANGNRGTGDHASA